MPHNIFENSGQFHSWSDGTKFVLRRFRRSDQAHFDLGLRLRDMDVDNVIDEACATFSRTADDCD